MGGQRGGEERLRVRVHRIGPRKGEREVPARANADRGAGAGRPDEDGGGPWEADRTRLLTRGSRSSNVLPGHEVGVRISEFDWDDGNVLHLELGHGIEPEEAEEVFAHAPLVRKTKRGHYAVFGRTEAGRLLALVFELRPARVARVITGWDMNGAERRYYQRHRRR